MKFFTDLFEKKKKSHREEWTGVNVPESLHNITEGSEFLNDAIRMQEQVFAQTTTEENTATGDPNKAGIN